MPIAPFRYGLAIALSLLALLLSLGLGQSIEESPFSLFLATVAISAWYGGLGPGLVATVLGGLICATFFLPPLASPTIATITSAVRLVIFLLVAVLISSLNATLRDARRRAEIGRQRLEFLVDASRRLAASLDYDDTFVALARLAVPRLGDFCIVDVIEEDGTIRRVAVAHAAPAQEALVRELCDYPPSATSAESIAQVLHTGTPSVLTDITDDLLMASIQEPRHREIMMRLGPRSAMSVPLRSRDRVLGAISLYTSTSRRRYSDADLDLAVELAGRAALAVDNARLYATARRAVRVRDEFLAMASHELRTPLSHIKGFVSTLRQPDAEWDDETQQEFLEETERETDRLATLIGDLLDMTRLETSRPEEAELAWVRPVDVVNGGLDRIRGLIADRQIIRDIPAELPEIRADATQLERVFANLVENAAKFSPSDTPIRIAASTTDDLLEISVEDEGPGIPPDKLDVIFEKFYRLRGDAAPVPGTGLGLAICRRIIETHGGSIHAENSERGARFVARLPVGVYAKGVAL
jgi:K+-sensing histidine kinase KdpD